MGINTENNHASTNNSAGNDTGSITSINSRLESTDSITGNISHLESTNLADSSSGAGTRRVLWVDACRAIAIILVLLGHNNPPFVRAIYGFHMPIFFILSGYVYKDRNTDRTLTDEIIGLLKGYIIPYLIFGTLNLLLHLLHLRISAPDTPITSAMVTNYILGILTVNTDKMPCCYPMWFLPSFAIAMFIFYLMRRFKFLWDRTIVFVLLTVVMFIIGQHTLPVNLQTIIPGILFAEFGYLTRHVDAIENHILQKPANQAKTPYILRLLAITAVFLILAVLCIHYNPVRPRVDISYGKFGNFFLFFLGAISASIVIMLLAIVMERLNPNIIRPLAFLGTHTVFFMAFDASTNSWGGTILTNIFGSGYSPVWHIAFCTRCLLMAAYFLIWLLLLKLIKPLKKLTHS